MDLGEVFLVGRMWLEGVVMEVSKFVVGGLLCVICVEGFYMLVFDFLILYYNLRGGKYI